MYCLFSSQSQKIAPQQTFSIVTLAVYLDEDMQWAVIEFVWVRTNLFNAGMEKCMTVMLLDAISTF